MATDDPTCHLRGPDPDKVQCGRSLDAVRSWAWPSAIPFYPRSTWCKTCRRAHRARQKMD